MEYDNFITHKIDFFMGNPKSGKTIAGGSYPKPLLYVSIGNDGGGRVLMTKYRDDVEKGLIKVKNLKNDPIINGRIATTSPEKLAKLLAELRKPEADKFKTIVIDTVGALQQDYKTYLEFSKGGKSLSQPEWGEVGKMVLNVEENMKRFSEETGTQFVWITHTRQLEVYETSGLNKEIRIVPDLTIATGVKFLKDASNVFYSCRKTIITETGDRIVKFLTYIGAHPLMDTGTRDLIIEHGDFVENFTYDSWQQMVKEGKLKPVNVIEVEENKDNEKQEIVEGE